MKKLGILLLLLCMFSFVGCPAQDEGSSDGIVDDPIVEEPMEPMEGMDDPGDDPGAVDPTE